MRKIMIAVLVVVVLVVAVFFFGRNYAARMIVVNGIKKTCGLDVDIAKVDISLPSVSVAGLKVYNPAGFKDRVLADIPVIYVNLDLGAFFKNKVHLNSIKLDIRELDIILNEKGQLNVNSLALLLPKPGGGKAPEVKIDELSLKIGKVVYKGYLPAAGARGMEFNPGIDETLKDVTNPSKVTGEILKKILSRIGIANFSKFDFQGGLDKVVTDAGAAAKEGLKGLFDKK